MTHQIGTQARFIERFGCYEVGDTVTITSIEKGNRYDLIHFIGAHGKGNCYSHRIEKSNNTQEEKIL